MLRRGQKKLIEEAVKDTFVLYNTGKRTLLALTRSMLMMGRKCTTNVQLNCAMNATVKFCDSKDTGLPCISDEDVLRT